MFDDTLGTTNVLLGIMAAVSLVQLVGLVIALVVAVRLYRDAAVMARTVGQELPPLLKRLNNIAAALEQTTTDVNAVTSRAARGAVATELALQTAAGVASVVARSAGTTLGSRALGALSIAKGARAAFRAFADSGRRQQPGRQSPDSQVHGPKALTIKEATHGA